MYFILFDATIKKLFSFLFYYSLLVYRNATNLYVLVIYPAILLNLFISSNEFFGEIFRVLCMYDLVFCK